MTPPGVVITVTLDRAAVSGLDLTSLNERITAMSEKLDQITQAVADQTAALAALQATVDEKQAAIAAAIAALEARIAAAGNDAELQAILDALRANNDQVADIAADVDSTPVPEDEAPVTPPADPPAGQ